TIIDRVLGAHAAGVHYRLFSVWTFVPVRLDKQLSDHSTVDEIASGATYCRLTYTMANCPQRRKKKRTKKRKKRAWKRRELVVLGSGEENRKVWFSDADEESKTRMRKNALRTGPRQAVDDEVHFWLNDYVKKQNCRIWSEANPQVYVETPLHPEKLTVWCALWAGGILLQKR
ncbi:hypothetical protein TNCV_4335721, partial [Trichonephila clavipes]